MWLLICYLDNNSQVLTLSIRHFISVSFVILIYF